MSLPHRNDDRPLYPGDPVPPPTPTVRTTPEGSSLTRSLKTEVDRCETHCFPKGDLFHSELSSISSVQVRTKGVTLEVFLQ